MMTEVNRMISRNSRFFFNYDDFLKKTIESRSIFVNNDNFKMLAVNETGNLILNLLNGENTVDELVEKMSEHYDLPFAVIDDYVYKYISSLYSDGLIYLDDSYKLEVEPLSIKRLYLELTNSGDENRQGYNELSLKKVKNIFDYVEKNKIDEEVYIYLKGNPMEHSNFKEIIRFIGQKPYAKIWLYTESREFTQEMIWFLKENVNVLVLKLYELDRVINNDVLKKVYLKKFSNNAKICVENQITCYSMIAPTAENSNILHEIHRISYDLGMAGMIIEKLDRNPDQAIEDSDELIHRAIKKIEDNNVFLNSWKNNRIQSSNNLFHLILEEELCFKNNYWMKKRKHCGIGIEEISLDNKGLIYPCHKLHYHEYSSKDIAEYESKKSLYGDSIINSECKECYYWILCLGGCRARNHNDGGFDSLRKDCEEIKGKLESLLFRV